MPDFAQYRDVDYTGLRKRLLRSKGNGEQRQFLHNALDRSSFLREFNKLGTVEGVSLPVAPHSLSESEYKDPPSDTEQRLYNAWRELSAGTAYRSAFWAMQTVEHIREEILDPTYLAANHGSSIESGAERIERALSKNAGEKTNKDIDDCVRAVLRRLGGLPESRWKRSVYVDCPFARAWWRERLVEEVTVHNTERAEPVRKLLRLSQTHWEKFIDRIVSRNSTFGSKNIRKAFILRVSSSLNGAFTAADLQKLCRRASAMQGTLELSILSDQDLGIVMQNLDISLD